METTSRAVTQAYANSEQGRVSFTRANDSTLLVTLSGPWHLTRDVPSTEGLRREIESASMLKTVAFDTSGLTHWDSGLVSFLVQTSEACRAKGIKQDRKGLPDGLRRLLELAEAVPEKKGTRGPSVKAPFFERVGNMTLGYGLSVGEFMGFLGELTAALAELSQQRFRAPRAHSSQTYSVLLRTFAAGRMCRLSDGHQRRGASRSGR